MSIIYSSNNTPIIVDDKLYGGLISEKWFIQNSGYAYRTKWVSGKTKHILMHRELMGNPRGLEIDHINGNRLDNRLLNLRIVTRSMNKYNCPVRKHSVSGIKGVGYDKRRGLYRARITYGGKEQWLGYHKTIDGAKVAYIDAAKRLGIYDMVVRGIEV